MAVLLEYTEKHMCGTLFPFLCPSGFSPDFPHPTFISIAEGKHLDQKRHRGRKGFILTYNSNLLPFILREVKAGN